MPHVILASTSPYRRELLSRLGIPFECHAPQVDEDAWKAKGLPPHELAQELGAAKAESLAGEFPESIIIGSDQVCACDGQIFGKPGSAERAIEQLEFFAGREHQLITAVAVSFGGAVQRHTDVTTLRMRALSREAIARYVAADQPLDCAGSYRLEQAGIALFEAIDSADHTAIVGLPLIAVCRMLRACGIETP